ncbi:MULTISPECIES: cysteine desulfurase family protein [Chryseobacterium]|uniref:cysteine desulfurase n=1 Tax=Chryseobacterium camelliae TaxID=1265445 RepID=A0ABU0TFT2_9FLAO|nr:MULTISPECIES: cysteine desulfurase family protein [Chryseobacterium]MDT3406282.1 cysteine desulfurase [Pseudacidovorax intermedius]MDQ1095920.1 cysteine desulfurase [Chryseobacterium camelliae]MDQ1099856.1 cysteine desulfurase [Chryseobacterium sp. SORGH_AS_1048]MDR6087202.1 cysteine desulfurase [Chryseobacterium sp. SORGH_AS_0909]MDR6131576.1 cysteine desulfurase [Chryseobacterium sp. SORGH_AS_1175]
MNPEKIYLDNNATTRMDDRVLEAMIPFFTTYYENAGSSHLSGMTVQEYVEEAAWNIAELTGGQPEEYIFTSGATEAINLAISGLEHSGRKHIVTLSTEHKAVLDTCRNLEDRGYNLTVLKVETTGLIDHEILRAAITDETLLVCVMMVNNETGIIQDVQTISLMAHEKGALFLCDATQAVGKIPVDVSSMGIDLMPVSAHKFYGPKGSGALYVSRAAKIKLQPQILGGGQQKNRRSGTLNVPGIIGLGKACEIAALEMDTDAARIRDLRDTLEKELLTVKGSFINGVPEHRLHTTANICFPGINAEQMIMGLQHISVSNGSACSSVTSQPSHVLTAMGLSDEEALNSIRFSLGKFNTITEILQAAAKVRELIAQFSL